MSLTLTRREGSAVRIRVGGHEVVVVVSEIHGSYQVKLRFYAERDVEIIRLNDRLEPEFQVVKKEDAP